MNLVVKVCLGMTAALVLNFASRAEETVSSDTSSSSLPYATIVARNIFGLVPVPPPPPPPPPPVDPPPKITANGITTILGELQALFKVDMPAKAGQPAKQNSYMLSEGERQDDIEVTKIDEKSATITFNNHGVVQEIPLVAGQASNSAAVPAAGGPTPNNPFLPPRFRNRPQGFGNAAAMMNGGGSIPAPASNSNPFGNQNQGLNGGGTTQAATQSNPQDGSNLTAEEQAILIETERARLLTQQEAAGKSEYPQEMLPFTHLTPDEAKGSGNESVPAPTAP